MGATGDRPRAARMSRAARRAQVLDVAQDLFSREGYHHVSMDDIADRAEVSKPVLYRHFPSKLDLYLAVVDHRSRALVEAVDDALGRADAADAQAHASGREVVRAVVRAFVEFVEDSGESFSLLFESDVTRDPDVREQVEQATSEAATTICRALRELAGLPQEQALLAAHALVGMVRVAATSRYRAGEVSVDDAVDLVTQLGWRGVAGLVTQRTDSTA